MKRDPFKNLKLDAHEQEIEDAIGRGEFVLAPNQEKLKREARASAYHMLEMLRKNKNVSIRLPEMTIKKLKWKAAEEGLPYQTLIGSVLHKYVNGTL